jgi:quercetin dioxygenase-like cupin family protein
MPTHRLRLALLIVLPTLLAGAAIGYAVAADTAKEPVTRDALAGSKHPRGAKGRTLGLSRVVIQPGAELALHHHQGTQIAYIHGGKLTYSVVDGHVKIREGDFEGGAQVVGEIEAGETGKIRAGQWIVEQPTDHHMAANTTGKRIVIYLATLLKSGAPPSTPVSN